ncbi:uncharacterized protein LOC144742397 [Ciona intestinalis]
MLACYLRQQVHGGLCVRILHSRCGLWKPKGSVQVAIPYKLGSNYQNTSRTLNYHQNSSFLHQSQLQLPTTKKTFSTQAVLRNKSEKPPETQHDDLQAILKDKSLGITAKFKILLRQYGVVMVSVHLVTSVFWAGAFYFAVSRGLDVIPFLENIGLFEFLERWGFSYTEKIKNSGASTYLMAYLLYELAKPVRYPVTLFGTMYAVRYLRRIGFLKPPPKSATVGQLVETQSKIMKHRIDRTTNRYRDRYTKYRNSKRVNDKRSGRINDKRNGTHQKKRT